MDTNRPTEEGKVIRLADRRRAVTSVVEVEPDGSAEPARPTTSEVVSLRVAVEAIKAQQQARTEIATRVNETYVRILRTVVLLGVKEISVEPGQPDFINLFRERDDEYGVGLVDGVGVIFEDLIQALDGDEASGIAKKYEKILAGRTRHRLPGDHRIVDLCPELLRVSPNITRSAGLIDRVLRTIHIMEKNSLSAVTFMLRATDPKEWVFEVWALVHTLDRKNGTDYASRFGVKREGMSEKKCDMRDDRGEVITNRELSDIETDGILSRIHMVETIDTMERKEGKDGQRGTVSIRGNDLYRPINSQVVLTTHSNATRPATAGEYIANTHRNLSLYIGGNQTGFKAVPKEKSRGDR